VKGHFGGRFHNWRDRHFTILQPELKMRPLPVEVQARKDAEEQAEKRASNGPRASLGRAGVVAAGSGGVLSRKPSREVSTRCIWGAETGEQVSG
jgi:hypothetical protein